MIRHRRTTTRPKFTISKKNLKSIVFSLACFSGITLGILVSGGMQESLPRVSEVECVIQDDGNCDTEVLASLLGQPIIFSNVDAIVREDLLTNGLTLQSYSRIWPDKVLLVTERAAIEFQAQTPIGFFGVMHDRRIVAMKELLPDKPTITMNDPLQATQLAPEWMYLSIISTAKEVKPTAMKLVSPVELRVNLLNGPLEFVLNPQQIEENLARMRVIVASEETAQLARVRGELDVRLRLPVLRKVQ